MAPGTNTSGGTLEALVKRVRQILGDVIPPVITVGAPPATLFPHPPDDTGIGVHWNTGSATAAGMDEIRRFWIPELQGMGVKWVKMLHPGGEALADALLQNGIMPVVRIFRVRPNPGTLSDGEKQALDTFLRLGVRYFEFNNEPDESVEWQGGSPPPNAPDIVATNAIVDMDTIISKGGLPGIPAVTVGKWWDLVGRIVDKGRADLFSHGAWHAIHNYGLNHPPAYPSDDVNQAGTPVSQEEYDRLARESVPGGAWGNDSREQVNAYRASDKNPGITIMSDFSCFRAFEFFDAKNRERLGFSIPILSTEDGYQVGDRQDRRYPRITPSLHAQWTSEICQVMMGTHPSLAPAPAYYFCDAHWLLGEKSLGVTDAAWESSAWYSATWPNGRLPVVDTLKILPKRVRTSTTLPPPPPVPVPLPQQQAREAGWRARNITYNADAAFPRYARANGLGAPLTAEFDFTANGHTYRGQGFVQKIIYAEVGIWDTIYTVDW
ncbi:MAG: hypothetical protein EXR62_07955 [Chloroflexi bacterium]|nr:hypothetical protein [Chloroflexota bacterium]